MSGLQELVEGCDRLEAEWNERGGESEHGRPGSRAALLWRAARDDATPLHWAAAGAGPKEFGESCGRN